MWSYQYNMAAQRNQDTILTEELQNDNAIPEHPDQPLLGSGSSKSNKKAITIGAAIFIATLVVMLIVILGRDNDRIIDIGWPQSIRITLPDGITQIQIGDSRVVEVLFYSGKDNRNSQDYTAVVKRNITWSTTPSGIITIDPYGRIETLTPGKVELRVESVGNSNAFHTRSIEVVEKAQGLKIGRSKMRVDYQGNKVKPNNLPQKLVTKITAAEALDHPDVPPSFKKLLSGDPQATLQTVVLQNEIKWEIKGYADGSNRSYVLRTNQTASDADRNKYQYFIGDRYLPGDGTNAVSIEDDGSSGVWVTDNLNEITHIVFAGLNSTSKAFKMVNDYKPYLRYGMASGTDRIGDSWVAGVSDNDGLWTSMFAVGQLMRYSVVQQMGYSSESIADARTSALKSLKAVLMISNVPSRNTTIDARIRHFNNTRVYDGTRMSAEFLKQGATYAVDVFPGNSMEGVGFYGNDAGQTINGLRYGGKETYTYLPFIADDWSRNATLDIPATSKRSIKGFIARSFGITGLDTIPKGGLFFQHNQDGTQKVLQDANRLYDYNNQDTPVLNLGNLPLPSILLDIININGIQYNKTNLFYKGDTSTDEVIGHIFLYKVAFDVLDEEDPEEKELKRLIVQTMVDFCTGLIDNGYSFVDATGQGTTWGKLVRDFINSDFTIEDAPVKAIEILMSFKVCGYVTGDERWQREYRYLIEDPAFRYLDVVAGLWKRWVWRNFNEDYQDNPFMGKLNISEDYTEEEVIRHVMMEIHYSDEEEALLAYYLAFQLERDQEYLKKYREGLEGWWYSISRSQNPLWYFIYQLAYPNQAKEDHFGSNLLEVSMWQLERHPVSTIKYTAYIEGSRPDIVCEGVKPAISVNPHKILQKRKHTTDSAYLERPLNKKTVPSYDPSNLYEIKVLPKDERCMYKFNSATFEEPYRGSKNSMEPPTTYTLPYWLGVYHKMIDIQ